MSAARTRGLAVSATILVVGLAGWFLRRVPDVRVDAPNASLSLVDLDGGQTRAPHTFALVVDTGADRWLMLSSAPLACRHALDFEQNPYPKDAVRIWFDGPPRSGATEVPFDGVPRAQACTNPSTLPERPKTSTLTIEAFTTDRLRGRLRVDQEGVVPGHKRCFDFAKAYHWTGQGTFDAPVCRTPWLRLKRLFDRPS